MDEGGMFVGGEDNPKMLEAAGHFPLAGLSLSYTQSESSECLINYVELCAQIVTVAFETGNNKQIKIKTKVKWKVAMDVIIINAKCI